MSASGDQIVAYQEDSGTFTFLYIVTTNSTVFGTSATNSNTTALPPGLTEGTTAVAVGSGPGTGDEVDNSTYNESVTSGTQAELLAAISNASNWSGNDTRIDPLADGPFTVGAAGTLVSETSSGGEGWRMLSAPGSGLSVADLAAVNLLRGIAAADTDPANLYTAYGGNQTPGGNDGFTAPAETDALVPGAGFWWYFFDSVSPPTLSGSGLGTVQALPVNVAATVTPLAADQDVTFGARTVSDDAFYLAGNPFATDFSLAGVSVTTGGLTLQDVVQVWDPAGAATGETGNIGPGGYVAYSLSGSGSPQVVTPWQGFWLEVTDGPGGTNPPGSTPTTAVTVRYAVASAGASGGTFVGRQAAYHDLKLDLVGATAEGDRIRNTVSLFFHEEASEGWDRFDASSPGSFGAPFVLAGLLGDRGDEADAWQYQDARPLGDADELGVHTFDLAYTGFGVRTSYEFAWPSLDGVPETWSLILRDTMTGTEVDLREQGSYAFETMEGEPAARFEVIVGASAVSSEEAVPAVFAVGELYPNPTASQATLAVQVAESQEASVAVYDVLGRQVLSGAVTLRAGSQERLDVDVSGLPAGTYVVRVSGASFAETRRLTVVR
ncbi:MAG: T9SS type A sorting domain-containing protein [Bacteroidota bacterium]